MVKKSSNYDSNTIQNLTPHQHLLKRMALTFGDETGSKNNMFSSQKTTALREILDNSLDEIRAGFGSYVRLSFFKDGSIEVVDSGRGIPVDVSLDSSGRPVSGIYKALGIIQSGGKMSLDSNRYSSGLNGVGGSSTIHTSRRSRVEVYRDKKIYELHFKDGTPGFFDDIEQENSPFEELSDYSQLRVRRDDRPTGEKKKYPTGTSVKVWLNDSVFQSEYGVDVDDLIERLKNTAYLVPSLKAEVYNEHRMVDDPQTGKSEPQQEFYHFEDGLTELLSIMQETQPIVQPLYFNTTRSYIEKNVPVLDGDNNVVNKDVERRVPIELMMVWGSGYNYSMGSYVNTINTKLGGVHEKAFETAIVKAFNERFATMRGLIPKNDELPIFSDFAEGLTVVLSVQVSEPSFKSQTKEELGGTEVKKAIIEGLTDEFDKWINSRANANELQVIAQKVSSASKSRQRAREKRDIDRKKNQISNSSLPTKLVDCEFAGEERSSLYICEGDSALSSLKGARNGEVDALLGIRGKIINAHKKSAKAVLDNSEVQDIIKSLGAGYGADFDINNMRYGRVFIAVDADPDGNAIACLLYSLFWHNFRSVITEGRLFKIETPLFSIAVKDGRKFSKLYARDDRERDSIIANLEKKKTKYVVSRLKGLGEVEPETLEETAINPKTRVVTQINVDDVERATEALDLIFGKDTDVRKEWMSSYNDFDEEEIL